MGESGTSLRKDLPSSQLRAILGSRGTFPKRGSLRSAHIFSAPPVEGGKICDVFYKEEFKEKNMPISARYFLNLHTRNLGLINCVNTTFFHWEF